MSKEKAMKTVAIIPAGGAGSRMGGTIPKQYLLLGGIPILVRSLLAFQKTPEIDAIVLVLPPDDVEKTSQTISRDYNLPKVIRIVAGGTQRQDSVGNGLAALEEKYDIVVIHDGVRPFVTQEMIRQVIAEAERCGAVTLGVPAKDTLKRVDEKGFVETTLVRDGLWLTQTPQAFALPLLKRAYEEAAIDGHYGTDDASLVERMGVEVKMLLGSYDNIKITTIHDLEVGESIVTIRNNASTNDRQNVTGWK